MSNSFKLSVIIPNYNNACYLSQCIESVLAQTLKDIEIVVSDDCSTDGSAEIISGYASRHSNIKAVFNSLRLGVSRNRHNAILASTARLITTLDSDDFYYHTCKLEQEFNLVEYYANIQQIDICAFSNIVIVDDKGNFLHKQWPDEDVIQGDIFSGVFSRTCMIPRDFTFSRDIYYRVGGYDPAFNLFEDWDLKIRLSRVVPFYFTGLDGIAYRKTGHGLSSAPIIDHSNAITKIYRKNSGLIRPEERKQIELELSGYLQKLKRLK